MKKMFRLMTLSMLIALLLLVNFSSTVTAQDGDGLSPEEQALLDRLVAAADQLDGYQTYVEAGQELTRFELAGGMMGMDFGELQSYERTFSTQYIWGEASPNVTSAQNLVALIESQHDEASDAEFTLDAELRYVEGTLYARAEYTAAEGDYPELPEGWTVLADSDDYHIFVDMDANRFLREDEQNLLRLSRLDAAITELSAEPATVNGVPVEVITLVVGAEGLLETDMDEDDDLFGFEKSMVGGIADMLGGDDAITLQVALDDANNPLMITLDFTLNVDADNFAMMLADVEGMEDMEGFSFGDESFQMTLTYHIETTYRQVNEELEPAAAPEIE